MHVELRDTGRGNNSALTHQTLGQAEHCLQEAEQVPSALRPQFPSLCCAGINWTFACRAIWCFRKITGQGFPGLVCILLGACDLMWIHTDKAQLGTSRGLGVCLVLGHQLRDPIGVPAIQGWVCMSGSREGHTGGVGFIRSLTSMDARPLAPGPAGYTLGISTDTPLWSVDFPQPGKGTRGALLQCLLFSVVPFWKMPFCICKNRAEPIYWYPLDFGFNLR